MPAGDCNHGSMREEDANLLFETLFDIRADVRRAVRILEEDVNGPEEEEKD